MPPGCKTSLEAFFCALNVQIDQNLGFLPGINTGVKPEQDTK